MYLLANLPGQPAAEPDQLGVAAAGIDVGWLYGAWTRFEPRLTLGRVGGDQTAYPLGGFRPAAGGQSSEKQKDFCTM
jgi:hypothetical protein